MKYKNLTLSFWILVTLVMGGCLTAEAPFYSEKDIIQNAHFVGSYEWNDIALRVTVSRETGDSPRYLVRLLQGSGWSEYLATLFRIDDQTYIDLYPTSHFNVMRLMPLGYPTASGLLEGISHDKNEPDGRKLHVLFRIEIGNDSLKLWVARKGSDPENVLARSTKIHRRLNGDGLIIDEKTLVLRSLLGNAGGAKGAFNAAPAMLKRN